MCPVNLIPQEEDAERLELHHDGSTFYYRRMPKPVRDRMTKKHTTRKRGAEYLDWGPYTDEALAWITLGWDNVVSKGKAIEFKPELIGYIPEEVLVKLIDASGANPEGESAEGGAQGNSSSTAGSKPTTKD